MKRTIFLGSIATVGIIALAACSDDATVSTSATAAITGTTTTTVAGNPVGSTSTTAVGSTSTTAVGSTSTTAVGSTSTTAVGSTGTTAVGSTSATTAGSTGTEPRGNQPPSALITAPVHLSNHEASFSGGRFGASINFTAIAIDPDGDPVTVEWFSSLEGFLGTGKNMTATIHTLSSDSSQPFITVRVTDQWGRMSEHQIQIVVWIPSTT